MSGGPALSFYEVLVTAQGDGTALSNSTTATSLLPPAARFTLASNFFANVGKMVRVKAHGRISTLVTSPGTLTLDVRFGTVASPIVVFNGGAMNLNTTAQTNATWEFEADLVCRAIGSSTSAQVLGAGRFTSRALIGSAAVASGYPGSALLPDTAPTVGTGFDSTVTNVVDFFATWSAASSSNSIQLQVFSLESLN